MSLTCRIPCMRTWISIKGSECSSCPLPNRLGLWSEEAGCWQGHLNVVLLFPWHGADRAALAHPAMVGP